MPRRRFARAFEGEWAERFEGRVLTAFERKGASRPRDPRSGIRAAAPGMTEPEEAASIASAGATGATGPRDRWRILRPLAHRDFRALFSAIVLSIFAAGMWAVVMVYAVIAIGGGPVDLSLVAASNATGLLLCAIPGGIVADRVSRRMIVRAVSLADFLAITSVVVVGAYGPVGIPQLGDRRIHPRRGPASSSRRTARSCRACCRRASSSPRTGSRAIRPALQQAAGPAAAGMLLY